MTIDTVPTSSSDARRQAPIAMGPHAPEVLTYELVRTVLRDARFTTARGLGLQPQPHRPRHPISRGRCGRTRSAPTARHRTRFRSRNADPKHVVDYSCHPGRRLRHWDADRPGRW